MISLPTDTDSVVRADEDVVMTVIGGRTRLRVFLLPKAGIRGLFVPIRWFAFTDSSLGTISVINSETLKVFGAFGSYHFQGHHSLSFLMRERERERERG
jgi:hypothetical protein